MKNVFNLRLPPELRNKVEEEAKENELSINQFILYVLTKTLSYSEAYKKLQQTFEHVKSNKYKQVLKKIPARVPLTGDEF